MCRARSRTGWRDWRWKQPISTVAKAAPLEDRLAALNRLRDEPDAPATRRELTKCLARKVNLLAAKAARIVGECKIADLAPQMVEAFDRFMIRPETTDRRCEAKVAIVKAL